MAQKHIKVGRIWRRGNLLTGYFYLGLGQIVRFGCEVKDGEANFAFLSKQDYKEEVVVMEPEQWFNQLGYGGESK